MAEESVWLYYNKPTIKRLSDSCLQCFGEGFRVLRGRFLFLAESIAKNQVNLKQNTRKCGMKSPPLHNERLMQSR